MYLYSRLIKSHTNKYRNCRLWKIHFYVFIAVSKFKNIYINTVVDIDIKKAKANCFNAC